MTGIITTLFVLLVIVIILTVLRIYVDSMTEGLELSPEEIDTLSRELYYLQYSNTSELTSEENTNRILRIEEIKKKLHPFN